MSEDLALFLYDHGLVVMGAILGMIFASFGCVVGERSVRGESINGRSHCVCGRLLRPWENVPILGWLLARGRARCCGAAIPPRYVLCEIGLAAWFALLALSGLSVAGGLAAAGGFAVVAGVCAWRERRRAEPER